MDPALTQAIIGIAFAVVALGALSIYQQARIKREKREKFESVEATFATLADAPPGATGFFVARYRGNQPRFFRVYSDGDALLFLHAGPYFAMIEAETARGSDRRHWLLQAGRTLVIGLAGGAVMAVAALAVLARAVARNAGNNPEGAHDIMLWVLGIIAFLAALFVVIAPGVVWRISKRGAELDALPLSGLRQQAGTNPLCFRATPEEVTGIKAKRLDLHARGELGATLEFRHAPTGRWTIETVTTRDTRDAVDAFRRAFGPEAVALAKELQPYFAPKPVGFDANEPKST